MLPLQLNWSPSCSTSAVPSSQAAHVARFWRNGNKRGRGSLVIRMPLGCPLGTASILWNLEKQAQLKGNYSNHQEKLSCMKAQQSWRRFSQNMSWIQLFDVNIVCRCEAALGLNPSSNPPSGAGERCYSCESRWINNISKNMSLKLES